MNIIYLDVDKFGQEQNKVSFSTVESPEQTWAERPLRDEEAINCKAKY